MSELKNAKWITGFIPEQEIVLTPEVMEKIRQELENWYAEFLQKHFSPGRENRNEIAVLYVRQLKA